MAYIAHMATKVCAIVMPSFSHIRDVSAIGHNFKTDRRRTLSTETTGQELNLDENCPLGSGS